MKKQTRQTGRRGAIALCLSLAMVGAACSSDGETESEPVATEAAAEEPAEEPA